jgi:hypothetical protein
MISVLKNDTSAISVICLSNAKFESGFKILEKIKLIPLMLFRDVGILSAYLFNRGYLYKTSFYLCQISHMMFRSSAIGNLKFNYNYRRGGEDWDFILKALEGGEIRILPKRLLSFRYSYGSSTDIKINRKLKWDSYLLLLSKLPAKLRRGIFYYLLRLYIELFRT